MKIPIDKITIGPRQRAFNPDHAHAIAASFQDNGQIHNIGVRGNPDGTYLLIYGRHRLEAARIVQWTELEATVRQDITPEMEQELEYEEDVRRLDRSWQEKCIAVYGLKRLKERRTGETWSLRKMEDFTGFGKSQLGYMSQIAQVLNATPRDEEMWACENYTAAIKLLVTRVHKVVNDELQRRMQEATVGVMPPVPEAELPFDPDAPPAPPVQLLDTTEATPAPLVIKIQWCKRAFKDAIEGEDFLAGRAQCILGYDVIEVGEQIVNALAPNAFAVLWEARARFETIVPESIPFPLVWNRLASVDTNWPFSKTYVFGYVYTKTIPTFTTNRASVVTSVQDDDFLPQQVVEFSIDGVCPANMPVFCIGGVRPVHVAMTGRTPIFFEEDEVVAAKFIEELRTHYEETIPGVIVEVRS